jgi:hypothetical protein
MFTINARKNRIALVAVTTVALVAVSAIAYAFWSSDGDGAGAGATGTSAEFVVTSSAATGPALKPGAGEQSIAFAVENPSDGAQMLSNVAVTVANADGSAWTSVAGCSAADYTVGVPAITYADMAAGSTAAGTVTLTMVNSGTDQDGCKGAAVPLYFLAS